MPEKKIQTRNEILENNKWDLTPLFKDSIEWEKLFTEIENEISGYDKWKGKLGESAESLKNGLDFDLVISRKLENLYVYAHLKNDEDKSNQPNNEIYQRAINLYTRINEKSSFLTPEIQLIDDEKISQFLNDPLLADYKFYLEKILRHKPHTRNYEIEQILAMSGEMSGAPSQIFSQLDNVDLKFGTISDSRGEKKELSHGNFSTFLIDKDREVRKKAFFQYYKSYEDHKHTIAETLSASNKKDYFYSRVRNFSGSRAASVFSDNINENVYDNLIKAIRDNFTPLFKYLDFRKKTLKLDELHIYDTYVPLVDDVNFSMPYEQAVDVCIKALKPLGKEYQETLKDGLLNGWVDRYENKGKRSGAYSSGCYDSNPYILMNYEDNNINSLYTLIHEAGHSMHSLYSKQQPYVYSGYTIFVAEVASTFNETLLSKYLLELYKDDKKMRAYILNREIDNIRATMYRQTMFAEFEKVTHEIVERNQPLTLDVLQGTYKELLIDYFGDTLIIDEPLSLECLRIPHFYSAFYVYKYATGIAAAIALVDKVLDEGDKARDDYLQFLKLGGSKFPIDELIDAGVDMTKPEPVNRAISHFGSLVDKLIDELK